VRFVGIGSAVIAAILRKNRQLSINAGRNRSFCRPCDLEADILSEKVLPVCTPARSNLFPAYSLFSFWLGLDANLLSDSTNFAL
jgi:hypothetical protein